jgi:hypothetical protein
MSLLSKLHRYDYIETMPKIPPGRRDSFKIHREKGAEDTAI